MEQNIQLSDRLHNKVWPIRSQPLVYEQQILKLENIFIVNGKSSVKRESLPTEYKEDDFLEQFYKNRTISIEWWFSNQAITRT